MRLFLSLFEIDVQESFYVRTADYSESKRSDTLKKPSAAFLHANVDG